MARPHNKADLSRYAGRPKDPALYEVWQSALRRTVTIPIEGSTSVEARSTFNRLRFKLYELRLILEAENDPLAPSLKLLTITSKKVSDTKFLLTLGAGDKAIHTALKKAGFLNQDPEDEFFDPTKD